METICGFETIYYHLFRSLGECRFANVDRLFVSDVDFPSDVLENVAPILIHQAIPLRTLEMTRL